MSSRSRNDSRPERFGRDHVGQAAVAEGVVADEIDGGDLGAAAFVDLEDDVDAVFAEIDRSGW